MRSLQGDVLMGTIDDPADGAGEPQRQPDAESDESRERATSRPRPPWDRPEQRAALPELYDTLTLLPNETLLIDRLSMALTRTHRTAEPIGVIRCTIEPIATLRASEGDERVDKILTLIAKRLQRSVRTCDTVARADGDQFILLLERLADAHDVHVVLDRVRAAMSDPIVVDRAEHLLTPVMGGITTNDPMLEIDELLGEADRLLGQAEAAGDHGAVIVDWTLRIFGDAAAALDSRPRPSSDGPAT
jgi:diguanylate cyclase (GGDEF)-like protein